MDIGLWLKDWSTPLSAGATLAAVIVALGIGVASIIQTHSLQKRALKERLLNEIIKWTIDILNSGHYKGFDEFKDLTNKYLVKTPLADVERKMFFKELLLNTINIITESHRSYFQLTGKCIYIIDISKYFGKDVFTKVTKLSDELSDRIKVYDQTLKELKKELNFEGNFEGNLIVNITKSTEELRKQRDKMDILAYEVIRVTNEIVSKSLN